MKRKRDSSSDEEEDSEDFREKKRRKINFNNSMKISVSNDRSFDLAFIEPSKIPKNLEFEEFKLRRSDKNKKRRKIVSKEESIIFSGKNDVKPPSKYYIGLVMDGEDEGEEEIKLYPMNNYYIVNQSLRSERLMEEDGSNEVDISDYSTVRQKTIEKGRKERRKKGQLLREDEMKYRKERDEIVLERPYLPPYNEKTKKRRKIYSWVKMIGEEERYLVQSEIFLFSDVERYPKIIQHYIGVMGKENEEKDEEEDDEEDEEDSVVIGRKEKRMLNYYKSLCYLMELKDRFRNRSFSFSEVQNDHVSAIRITSVRLWNLMSEKFLNKTENQRYLVSDKRKIVCYSLALILNVNKFVLRKDLIKKIMIDMRLSLDEVYENAKGMGCRVDKEKEVIELKAPLKLPKFSGSFRKPLRKPKKRF